MRAAFDQAFHFESLQRLGDRQKAHVKLVGQAPAGKDVSNCKVATKDLFTYMGVSPVSSFCLIPEGLLRSSTASLPSQCPSVCDARSFVRRTAAFKLEEK
jgi:hypothetical protein